MLGKTCFLLMVIAAVAVLSFGCSEDEDENGSGASGDGEAGEIAEESGEGDSTTPPGDGEQAGETPGETGGDPDAETMSPGVQRCKDACAHIRDICPDSPMLENCVNNCGEAKLQMTEDEFNEMFDCTMNATNCRELEPCIPQGEEPGDGDEEGPGPGDGEGPGLGDEEGPGPGDGDGDGAASGGDEDY